MNSRNRLIYSLAGVSLLAAACGVNRETYTTTIEQKWPATSLHRIEVREVDGAISVEAGTGDAVTLVAHVRSHGVRPKKGVANEGFFETAVNGDTLEIGRRKNEGSGMHFRPFWTRESYSVDYQLRVPPQVALELRTVNGRIATRGVDGETAVTTVNGPIDVEMTGNAELVANTVNGRVDARFLKEFQGAKLRTVNGEVRAVLPASASFSGDFTQVNGDFEAAFPMNIHSNPGSRRVSGAVNGGKYELKITTVNGDIQLETSAPAAAATPAAPATPAATAPATPAAPAAPPAPSAAPATPAPAQQSTR